ncbi:MAG: tRNA pseudouridine(54/55) synthase Pus10 [Halodesulfurarchaeum sp.]
MSILADASAVLENGPVCDPCLGRCFADLSHGLTNEERGRSLRVAVAMAEDEPVGEETECWVCEGASRRFDEFADRATAELAGIEFETYQVGTRVPPLLEENEAMLRDISALPEDAGEQFKSEANREVGKRIGRETGRTVDFERPDVQVLLDLEDDTVDVHINSAFVYGRYRKLERGIPQTKWPCRECNGTGERAGEPCIHCEGTGYTYPESVEQLIAPPVLSAMEGEEAKFHGAGREDIDALMVGTGRPFVLEVIGPKRRFPDLGTLLEDVNDYGEGRVEVDGLRFATYEMVERVKSLPASKTYRATVEFDEPVSPGDLSAAIGELDGRTVEQETPRRVDHRRASKVRERTVYDIDGEVEDERHATLEIHGEGGLYVKELVSGDAGRTRPSLAGLLDTDVYVTALDVVAVRGEQEEFEDDSYFREPPNRKDA